MTYTPTVVELAAALRSLDDRKIIALAAQLGVSPVHLRATLKRESGPMPPRVRPAWADGVMRSGGPPPDNGDDDEGD